MAGLRRSETLVSSGRQCCTAIELAVANERVALLRMSGDMESGEGVVVRQFMGTRMPVGSARCKFHQFAATTAMTTATMVKTKNTMKAIGLAFSTSFKRRLRRLLGFEFSDTATPIKE